MRRTSRTKKMVFSTTPATRMAKRMIPRTRRVRWPSLRTDDPGDVEGDGEADGEGAEGDEEGDGSAASGDVHGLGESIAGGTIRV